MVIEAWLGICASMNSLRDKNEVQKGETVYCLENRKNCELYTKAENPDAP